MAKFFWLCSFAFMLLAIVAFAAIPDSLTVSFQARNSTTGNVLQLLNTDVTVNIYASPTGGVPVWNQTKTRTTSPDGFGYFYATSIDLPFDIPYYYCIKVEGMDECPTRINMTTVPYAFFAKNSSFAVVASNATFASFSSGASVASVASSVDCSDIASAESNLCTLIDTNTIYNDAGVVANMSAYAANLSQHQGNISLLLNSPGQNATNASYASVAGFCSAFSGNLSMGDNNISEVNKISANQGFFNFVDVIGQVQGSWADNISQVNDSATGFCSALVGALSNTATNDTALFDHINNLTQATTFLNGTIIANNASQVAYEAQQNAVLNGSINTTINQQIAILNTSLNVTINSLPKGNETVRMNNLVGTDCDYAQGSFMYGAGVDGVPACAAVPVGSAGGGDKWVDLGVWLYPNESFATKVNASEFTVGFQTNMSSQWLNASNLSGKLNCVNIEGASSNLCTLVDTDTIYDDAGVVANMTAFIIQISNLSQVNVTALAQAKAYADSLVSALPNTATNDTALFAYVNNLSQVNVTALEQAADYTDAQIAGLSIPDAFDNSTNASFANVAANASFASSANYNDLTNKPNIPSAYNDDGVVQNMTAFLLNFTLAWANFTKINNDIVAANTSAVGYCNYQITNNLSALPNTATNDTALFNYVNNLSQVNITLYNQIIAANNSAIEYALNKVNATMKIYVDGKVVYSDVALTANDTAFFYNFTLTWANFSSVYSQLNNLSQVNRTLYDRIIALIPSAFNDLNLNNSINNLSQVNVTLYNRLVALIPAAFNDLKINNSIDNLSQVNVTLYNRLVALIPSAFNDLIINNSLANLSQVNQSAIAAAKVYADLQNTTQEARIAALALTIPSAFDDLMINNSINNLSQVNVTLYNIVLAWINNLTQVNSTALAQAKVYTDLQNTTQEARIAALALTIPGAFNDLLINNSINNLSQVNITLYNRVLAWVNNLTQINTTVLEQANAYADANDADTIYDDSGVVINMSDALYNWTLNWDNWTQQNSFNNNISQVNKTLWDSTTTRLQAQDACSEISGCVVGAITSWGDGNITGNATYASNASGVPCGGISGAASDLCTLTVSGYDDAALTVNDTVLLENASQLRDNITYLAGISNHTNLNVSGLIYAKGLWDAGDTISNLNPEANDITLMLWYPKKGAFRAGEWDITIPEEFIGNDGSAAFGYNTLASGLYAFVFGSDSNASGESSLAGGDYSNASGSNSIAIGFRAKALGTRSVALGKNALANGSNAIAIGEDAIASGLNAVSFGGDAYGDGSFVLSVNDAIARGESAVIVGVDGEANADYSFVANDGNVIDDGADSAAAFGVGNRIYGYGENSFIAGQSNILDGFDSFLFGNSMVINQTKSFTVGWDGVKVIQANKTDIILNGKVTSNISGNSTGVLCSDIWGAASDLCTLTASGYDDAALTENFTIIFAQINNLTQVNVTVLQQAKDYADSVASSYDDSGVVINMTDALYNWTLNWANWTAQNAWNSNQSQVNDTLYAQCVAYADANDADTIYDDAALTTNWTNQYTFNDNISQVNDTLYTQCVAYADSVVSIFDDSTLNASIDNLTQAVTILNATIIANNASQVAFEAQQNDILNSSILSYFEQNNLSLVGLFNLQLTNNVTVTNNSLVGYCNYQITNNITVTNNSMVSYVGQQILAANNSQVAFEGQNNLSLIGLFNTQLTNNITAANNSIISSVVWWNASIIPYINAVVTNNVTAANNSLVGYCNYQITNNVTILNASLVSTLNDRITSNVTALNNSVISTATILNSSVVSTLNDRITNNATAINNSLVFTFNTRLTANITALNNSVISTATILNNSVEDSIRQVRVNITTAINTSLWLNTTKVVANNVSTAFLAINGSGISSNGTWICFGVSC